MMLRIFGDGLDALIMSYSLSKTDIPFEWVVTKDRPGGYFSGGRNCVGNPVDLGMVLLEPNNFNTRQMSLSEYAGEEGHLARPFLDGAYSFLEVLFGEFQPVSLEVKAMDGNSYPDYFISDSIDWILRTDKLIQEELLNSLNWLRNYPEWHPKNKRTPNSFISTVGISSYYKKIYGEELYKKFFKGYLESFLGDKVDLLPAHLHRRAWVPLYWPETLLSYSRKEINSKDLFQPKFTRPSQGSVAKWVDSMTEFVFNSEKSEIKKVQKIDPAEYGNFVSKADFAFLDSSCFSVPDEKNTLVPASNFVQIRIIHFCVNNFLNKVIFLNGNDNGCFRYSLETNGPLGLGSITFEFGESSLNTDDEALVQIASEICQNLGLEARCPGTLFKGKLPISQPVKIEATSKRSKFGNSITLHSKSATSINDNIVRGTAALARIMKVEL